MAAPIVSSLAGLLISLKDSGIEASSIAQILQDGSIDLSQENIEL